MTILRQRPLLPRWTVCTLAVILTDFATDRFMGSGLLRTSARCAPTSMLSAVYYTGVKGWEFSLESYYKDMHNVLEYQDGATFFGSSGGWQEKVEMGRGRSFGLEVLAQKTIGKTTGWLGYTIAKSDRQFKNGTVNNGERFPYKYDRRHNINLCLNPYFSARKRI